MPWNQVQPPTCPSTEAQHSTMVFRLDTVTHILDHYLPFEKQLGLNYNILYAIKGIVNVRPIPLPLVPTDVAPTMANLSILKQIVILYQRLVSLVKGRNIQGVSMFTKLFASENKIWNWLVVSSADPTKVASTVKGVMGMFIVFLAYFIHGPNLNDLPDLMYSIVFALSGVFTALVTFFGLLRKVILSFDPDPTA